MHLDGYNQMDLITGKGPSARHEIFYFTESNLAAVRIDDFKYRFIEQPGGWIGDKDHPDVPVLVNLRLDPFEKATWPRANGNLGSYQYFDWFVLSSGASCSSNSEVAKLAMTAIEFPPAQKGASFNLDAVKAKIAEAMAKTRTVVRSFKLGGGLRADRPAPMGIRVVKIKHLLGGLVRIYSDERPLWVDCGCPSRTRLTDDPEHGNRLVPNRSKPLRRGTRRPSADRDPAAHPTPNRRWLCLCGRARSSATYVQVDQTPRGSRISSYRRYRASVSCHGPQPQSLHHRRLRPPLADPGDAPHIGGTEDMQRLPVRVGILADGLLMEGEAAAGECLAHRLHCVLCLGSDLRFLPRPRNR